MRKGPFIAIILTILWALSGLSGSEWFWVFLLIFPIFTLVALINGSKKWNPDDVWGWWNLFIIFIFSFFFIFMWLEEWTYSIGTLIIFFYILAFVVAFGSTFMKDIPRWIFFIPGIFFGVILSWLIGSIVERTQPKVATPPVIVKTGSIQWGSTKTWQMSTGLIILPYSTGAIQSGS